MTIILILIGIINLTILLINCELAKKFHIHFHYKPLTSRYWGFNSRMIIYECRCGSRKEILIYRAFGENFPIKTGSLGFKQAMELLNGLESETTKKMLEIDKIVQKKMSLNILN